MLGTFYSIAREVDRKLTKTIELNRPVVSVGNIACGGRAKTPFVIALSRFLISKGWNPVVLTRGYGRTINKNPYWLEPSLDLESIQARREECNDESLEVFFRSPGVSVLVGPHRAQNALNYTLLLNDPQKKAKTIFLLDDGFQHWELKRDYDLVLVDPIDYKSWTLPWGHLREKPAKSLSRAHLVLERGKDFRKRTLLKAKPEGTGSDTLVLTTRVKDDIYFSDMAGYLPDAVVMSLKDHAAADKIIKALEQAPQVKVVLGGKEAVKLLEVPKLSEFFSSGEASFVLPSGKEMRAYFADFEIDELEKIPLWADMEDLLREWS